MIHLAYLVIFPVYVSHKLSTELKVITQSNQVAKNHFSSKLDFFSQLPGPNKAIVNLFVPTEIHLTSA